MTMRNGSARANTRKSAPPLRPKTRVAPPRRVRGASPPAVEAALVSPASAPWIPHHWHAAALRPACPGRVVRGGRPVAQPQPEVQPQPVPRVDVRPEPLRLRLRLQQPHGLRPVPPTPLPRRQRDGPHAQPARRRLIRTVVQQPDHRSVGLAHDRPQPGVRGGRGGPRAPRVKFEPAPAVARRRERLIRRRLRRGRPAAGTPRRRWPEKRGSREPGPAPRLPDRAARTPPGAPWG